MSPIRNKVLLGVVLQQAGLVTAERVQQALEQQNKSDKKLKLGKILANKGDIKQKTADFFAERWSDLAQEPPNQPIGQYFKQAALLDEQQIKTILEEQKQTQLKFGELAIAKGWLKKATVEFFGRYLFSSETEINKAIGYADVFKQTAGDVVEPAQLPKSNEQLEYCQKVHEGFLQIKRKLLKLEDRDTYSEKILDRVLVWTGGQSVLTHELCQIFAKNSVNLIPGREVEQIDYLVHTKLLDDWENNELGRHLQTIKNRLLNNWQCESSKLLKLYQQILSQTVSFDRSQEQQELLNMGLVVKQQDKLIIANRIYQLVFNHSWVGKQLSGYTTKANFVATNTNAKDNRSNQPVFNTFNRESRNKFFQFKNILLLLTFVSLLSLLFNNVAKRTAVRVAFSQGNKLLKQKLYQQALAKYDSLLKQDSNYFQAWTYRGYALAGLQQYEQMRQSCSTATIIEPKAVYAWNCQGEALHNLGRDREAIAAFDKAIAIDRSEPIFSIEKGKSLKALGNIEESITVIQQAIETLEPIETAKGKESISNELAVAWTLLGNNYIHKGKEQTAVDSYDRALNYVPNYFPAQFGKGIAFNMAQSYSQAQNQFRQILDNALLTPTQQAQTLLYLGKTLCSSQQTSLGITTLEKAIELKPNYQIARQAIEECK